MQCLQRLQMSRKGMQMSCDIHTACIARLSHRWPCALPPPTAASGSWVGWRDDGCRAALPMLRRLSGGGCLGSLLKPSFEEAAPDLPRGMAGRY